MSIIVDFQQKLKKEGFYLSKVDGQWGPLTQAACEARLRSLGQTIPPWMVFMAKELGMREVKGTRANPRILEYHRHTSLEASSDEVAWCSAFENWGMDMAGIAGTHNAAARSWMSWGDILPQAQLRYGAVAVFERGTSGWEGHVTNVVHWAEHELVCLGGNQGDAVSVAVVDRSRLLGFRWPSRTALAKAGQKLA